MYQDDAVRAKRGSPSLAPSLPLLPRAVIFIRRFLQSLRSRMKLPRNAQIWFPGYMRSRMRNWVGPERRQAGSYRVWVAIADHFEPLWAHGPSGAPDDQTARSRVSLWAEAWPVIARRHLDAAGSHPQYTFFFPQEEYRPCFIEPLASMAREGIADVEIHIHHNGEGQQNFVDRIRGFQEVLFRQHGLLRKDAAGHSRSGLSMATGRSTIPVPMAAGAG